MKTFYITTPIYYVNDKPHIGHAYTTILADVISRFHRNSQKDVLFLTGLDEHGQKVEKAAQESSLDTNDFVNKMSENFKAIIINQTEKDFTRKIELIEVPDEEYDSMGCNVLAIAPKKVIMLSGNSITEQRLKDADVEVHTYDGSEISIKGAGGPTCLTRPFYRI